MNLFNCTTVMGMIASILATHRNADGVAISDNGIELEFREEYCAFQVRLNPDRHLEILCRASPYIQETKYITTGSPPTRYILSREEITERDVFFDELLKHLLSARWTVPNL